MANPREQLCRFAEDLYRQGLTHGTTGNISLRQSDGSLLITPTGASFGRLDPSQLSVIDDQGRVIEGPKPTKEVPLHLALYHTRSRQTGAVVHLHSCHATALSMLPCADPDDWLPPLTPYSVMKLGKVTLLPYFMPGDPAIGQAIRGLAGKRSAIMLANHGPVVAAKDLEAAVYAAEELEAAAKLALLTQGLHPTGLSSDQLNQLVKTFDVEWD